MNVGDLVLVRFVRVIQDITATDGSEIVWVLGIIVDDQHYDAGLYKVHVAEYNITRKYFINDLRAIQNNSYTIYETD